VAEVAREHGLRPVLHHHAGSYVEFPDELAALLEAVPADEMGACLDTGHALYAGADAAALARELGPRLEHVHLKDVDGARLDAVLERGGGFWDAVGGGVFCPIGTGSVDFAAVARALEAVGYAGAATLEQDLEGGRSERALDDLRASIEALRGSGVAAGR
jgi:inosose dehydratase